MRGHFGGEFRHKLSGSPGLPADPHPRPQQREDAPPRLRSSAPPNHARPRQTSSGEPEGGKNLLYLHAHLSPRITPTEAASHRTRHAAPLMSDIRGGGNKEALSGWVGPQAEAQVFSGGVAGSLTRVPGARCCCVVAAENAPRGAQVSGCTNKSSQAGRNPPEPPTQVPTTKKKKKRKEKHKNDPRSPDQPPMKERKARGG